MQSRQFGEHSGAETGVEGGERFVQKQDAGADGQRPRDGDALLLAAGELARMAFRVRGHADEFQGLGDPAGDLGLRVRWALSPNATLSLTLRCGKEA